MCVYRYIVRGDSPYFIGYLELTNNMQMDPESHISLWNIFVSLLQKCFYSLNRHYTVAKCIVGFFRNDRFA